MSLDRLPDDVILDITSHLTTARDVASVSRTCRDLHRAVNQGGGWRCFVRRRFTTYAVNQPRDGRWDALAASLTAQSRSWDRKSLLPVAYTPAHAQSPHSNFFAGQNNRRLHHPFSPVLDAGCVWNDAVELVVWGAGEDVVGRFRPLASKESRGRKSNGDGNGDGGFGGASGDGDAWFCFEGQRNGYSPVRGDVTAIKLIEPGGKLGMLVGRASGELHLISAERENASSIVETFRLPAPPSRVKAASWGAAAHVDVFPGQTSIVTGNRATVSVFPLLSSSSSLGGTITEETLPLDSHTFHGKYDRSLFVHGAKVVTNDTIACALGGDPAPLRWLQATPTGLVPKAVDKSDHLLRTLSKSVNTTIRALEVVPTSGLGSGQSGGSNNGNLLLSAWDDGTVRLLDTRTPSPYDMMYRDSFQPEETISSLLTWGAHHFVAGSNEYPHLKTFDYRWPEHHSEYRYTDALPCSAAPPFPAPPDGADWTELPPPHPPPPPPRPPPPNRANSRCDHVRNIPCTFHGLARDDEYRPNACLILQPSPSSRRNLPSRVHSLAKSSSSGAAADAFYVGLPGAVAEMRLAGEGETRVGALVGQAASRRGWQAEAAQFAFLETGRGVLTPLELGYPGLGINSFSPLLVQRWAGRAWTPPESARWHRWDRRFWRPQHFGVGESNGDVRGGLDRHE